jgi:DNA polymerase-3 subunit chi
MIRIDFYILNGQTDSDRQVFACRLAEKAYNMGLEVYIHTESERQTEAIHQLLWSFRADSFVPHQSMTDTSPLTSPVLIGHAHKPPRLMNLLINLNAEQPMFFSQFERLAEIIDGDEETKQAGRARFQFYKHRGYELKTHQI